MRTRVLALLAVSALGAACASSAGDRARVEPGVRFAPGLNADVYHPAGSGPHPAAVLVHGGGFTSGVRQDMAIVAEALQERGMVAATVDYRLSSGTWFPATSLDDPALVAAADLARQDATTAIEWLRSQADTYGVDPDRIVVAGFSAGGIAAIEVASHGAPVVGAVSMAGGATQPAALDSADPPFVLFHGTADDVVPFAIAEYTCAAATAAGATCTVRPFPDEGHGIVGPHVDQIADEVASLATGSPG